MVESDWIRNPVVANLFYPANPLQLKTTVERFLVREKEIKKTPFLLVPHAGYIYSGSAAGKTFACSEVSKRVIILGPNHTGLGKPISVWSKGLWKTPLGSAKVDEEISSELLNSLSKDCEDKMGHLREHSIEVELPFMQVRYQDFTFVPVCVGTENFDELIELGESIAKVFKRFGNDLTLIVSSDMNHYESAKVNKKKDGYAIEKILKVDEKGLYEVVQEKNISMCGFAPCVSALYAMKTLGFNNFEVVDYTHSGLITNDDSEVVSYAGIRCFKE